MVLNKLQKDSFLILEVIGDLDASSCLVLDTAIGFAMEQNEKAIVIDCTKMHYISSAGLGVFVSYLSDFEANGVYFALLNVNNNVKNIISVLGLEKLVNIIEQLPNR